MTKLRTNVNFDKIQNHILITNTFICLPHFQYLDTTTNEGLQHQQQRYVLD